MAHILIHYYTFSIPLGGRNHTGRINTWLLLNSVVRVLLSPLSHHAAELAGLVDKVAAVHLGTVLDAFLSRAATTCVPFFTEFLAARRVHGWRARRMRRLRPLGCWLAELLTGRRRHLHVSGHATWARLRISATGRRHRQRCVARDIVGGPQPEAVHFWSAFLNRLR